MSSATVSFRPFTKSDWEGFAGCETKTPHIAEFDFPLGDCEGAALVLDGRMLQLHLVTEDGEFYGNQFATEAEAREFAEAALAALALLPFVTWWTMVRNVLK